MLRLYYLSLTAEAIEGGALLRQARQKNVNEIEISGRSLRLLKFKPTKIKCLMGSKITFIYNIEHTAALHTLHRKGGPVFLLITKKTAIG